MTPIPNDPASSRPDRRGAFLLLFCCMLAVGAGNTMLTAAVLPPLTRELGLPDWTGGAIFSLSAAVWVVAAPYWGTKSNTWGRRPVAALGMVGFAASMVIFGLVSWAALVGWINNWVWVFALLLFSRTLFGVFGSATNPAAQAYIADRTSLDERTREIASLTSGFTLGQVAGPAAAAVLIAVFSVFSPIFGLVAPVFVTTIIACVIAYMVMVRLPENHSPSQEAGHVKSGQKGLWKRADIFPFLVYAVGLSLVTGVLQQTFPYAIMDKMGLAGAASAQFTGPAITIGAMATLCAQLILIPRLELSPRNLMIYGAIMLSISSFIMVWAVEFAVFAFAQILFGLGQGFSRPGFTAGASLAASDEEQGDIAGLVTAANGMGFVVSPFFGLAMYEHVNKAAPFIFVGVLLVALAIYASVTTRKAPTEAAD